METNSELVMSIVFDNDSTFQWLTKQQTKNVLLTNKQASKNKNAIAMRNKYYALKLYYDLYALVYKVGTAVHYARTPMQKSLSRRMQRECDVIIKNTSKICYENEGVCDCMSRIIIADFKESLYTEMYNHNDTEFARFMRALCASVFINELKICNVQNHVHDPTHYVFHGAKQYTFYEKFEKHGLSMIEEHQKWINSDHYDNDEDEYDDTEYSDYDEEDDEDEDDEDDEDDI